MYNIYIGQLKGKPEEFKKRETKKKIIFQLEYLYMNMHLLRSSNEDKLRRTTSAAGAECTVMWDRCVIT